MRFVSPALLKNKEGKPLTPQEMKDRVFEHCSVARSTLLKVNFRNNGREPWSSVMGGDSCSKGREFESRHYILDGHFFTYLFVVKFVMCVWKDKNKWKRDRCWPIKKSFVIKISHSCDSLSMRLFSGPCWRQLVFQTSLLCQRCLCNKTSFVPMYLICFTIQFRVGWYSLLMWNKYLQLFQVHSLPISC